MAFVGRTARDFGHKKPERVHVGPGCYDPGTQHAQKSSYAPFSSSEERPLNFAPGEYNPGPGSYIRREFLQTAPVTSHQFTSKVHRLAPQQGTHLDAPGPGAYNHKKSWIKSSSKVRTRKPQGSVQWVRVQQAPSIPAPNQSFGYEENEVGELVPQVQPLLNEAHSGIGGDAVGPGAYDPNPTKFRQSRASHATFGKSKVHRQTKIVPSKKPGPGQYNPEPVKARMRGPQKRSANFASRITRRSYTGNLTTPGPGTYETSTTIKGANESAPPMFQFFGSSVNRYLGPPELSSKPGPGAYSHKSSFTNQDEDDSLLDTKAAFGIQAVRDLDRPVATELDAERGPGSYQELPNMSYELSRKVFGRCGSFGTTAKRFSLIKKPARGLKPTPGPGAYTQKRLLQPTRKTGAFASGVHRMPVKKVTAHTTPGPGAYTPHGFVSFSNEFKDREAAVFKRADPRFKVPYAAQNVAHASVVGPGSYDSAPQPAKKVTKSVFNSRTTRFEDPINSVPGPGAYVDPTFNLVKPTFNATIGNDFVR